MENLQIIAENNARILYNKIHYLIRDKPNKHSNSKLVANLCLFFIDEIMEQNFGEGYNHQIYVNMRLFIMKEYLDCSIKCNICNKYTDLLKNDICFECYEQTFKGDDYNVSHT